MIADSEDPSQVLKTTLLPAIFRLVQRNFGDTETQVPDLLLRQDVNLDQWVECWVGCIDVLVRNNMKVSGQSILNVTAMPAGNGAEEASPVRRGQITKNGVKIHLIVLRIPAGDV